MHNDISVHRVVKTEKRAGQFIAPHRHPFFHYIYSLHGRAMVTVQHENFLMEERTLMLVPPEALHSVVGVDVACSVDIKFSCSPQLQQQLTELPVCLHRLGEREDSLIRSIFEEAVVQNENYDEMVNIHLYELLILLLRNQHQSNSLWQSRDYPIHGVKNEQIRHALQLIETQICQPIKIADLAAECGYNKNYFQAFFKENVGINPNSYINHRKISCARDLMMYSSMKVTQISEYLGFQSIHYFSRLFKSLTGYTPTAYMRRVKQACPINVLQNEYTPAGEFEIPLCTAGADSVETEEDA
ncbi:MAG: AraC family transcriptional regulator [Clostridiales bacterium]|nr:AraC family transcriptional regulator [Clostridiales bacterium]